LEQAIEHQQRALSANPSDPQYNNFLRDHRRNLLRELTAQGQHSEAVEQAQSLVAMSGDSAAELIAVAELLVKSRQTVLADAGLPEDQRRAAVDLYERHAIDALQKSVRASSATRAALAKNSALAPLQENSAFRALLAGQ
jgi:hypothetical protein